MNTDVGAGFESSDDARRAPRIVPSAAPAASRAAETGEWHLSEYEFAARHVGGRRVLVLGSGLGFGAWRLRRAGALSVLAVEASEERTALATASYAGPGLTFVCGELSTFEPPEAPEVIVCLDEIARTVDASAFVERMVDQLPRAGVLVASACCAMSSDVDPTCHHDFSDRTFRHLLASLGLDLFDEATHVEHTAPWALLNRRRSPLVREGLARFYAKRPVLALRRLEQWARFGSRRPHLVVAGRKRS